MQPRNRRPLSAKSSAHKRCLLVAPPSLPRLPCHLSATHNRHQPLPASPVTLTHPSIPCQSSFHLHRTDGMHPRPVGRHPKSAPSRLRAADVTFSTRTLSRLEGQTDCRKIHTVYSLICTPTPS